VWPNKRLEATRGNRSRLKLCVGPHSMATIGQLTAQQLARHAFNVFLFSGRHRTGARLIYRALELDSGNAQALRCLSDLLDADGTHVFSGVVLEYALSETAEISGDDRADLDNLRFLAKWSWGFSLHKSGEPHLAQEAFADRSSFVVDEERYKDFLAQLIGPAGSLQKGYKAAHTLCGAMAGFLLHREGGGNAGLEESVHPERFVRTDEYSQWLQGSTEELDALEVERQKKSGARSWWKLW
jgi:hypothetical protein